MLVKILALLAILFIVYILFFKIQRKNVENNTKKRKKNASVENFVECEKCSTFVELKDTVLKDGKYICKECIKKEQNADNW
ncbi:PP0621 family protein [Campylobacter sputorum]|uniref:PP0621 family protein n=1 Tax=Campylobacter sputorum TaxID=206 RepID=UPI00053BF09B|nr:PP0621 family protein [Campylobacter sputorum]